MADQALVNASLYTIARKDGATIVTSAGPRCSNRLESKAHVETSDLAQRDRVRAL